MWQSQSLVLRKHQRVKAAINFGNLRCCKHTQKEDDQGCERFEIYISRKVDIITWENTLREGKVESSPVLVFDEEDRLSFVTESGCTRRESHQPQKGLP